ncbi:hypothetical protein ccbrp13_64970 [Ktedonobacteria bacterium brp13]|nr:hypothetical protein ccbrp13_64970 [Ktedonobacteria bacterium brp13]
MSEYTATINHYACSGNCITYRYHSSKEAGKVTDITYNISLFLDQSLTKLGFVCRIEAGKAEKREA